MLQNMHRSKSQNKHVVKISCKNVYGKDTTNKGLFTRLEVYQRVGSQVQV